MIRCLGVIAVFVLLWIQQLLAVSSDLELRKLLSKRPIIDHIEVTGNVTFDDKTVKSKMFSKEDGFWQSVSLMRANRYTKQAYELDPILLRYFYRSEGFDSVIVDINLTPAAKREEVVVNVAIQEGLRYRLREVYVSGDIGAEGHEVDVAVSILKKGSYYNPYALDIARNSVKAVFANRGYPYAVIDARIDRFPQDSVIDVSFNIVRNQLVLFGDVHVDSNLNTQPHVFLREVTFKRGDVYSRDRYIESQQRLIRTGLFNFVSLSLEDSLTATDSLQPNFRISAVERPPRFVGFGVGGAQDLEAGVALNLLGRFGDRNIAGTARAANFNVTTSFTAKDSLQIKPTYQFAYTEPYPFKTRMPLTMTLRYEPRAISTLGNYRIRVFSVDATAVREFNLVTKLSTSLDYQEVDVTADLDTTNQSSSNSTKSPEDLRDEEGISIYRRAALLLERDSRPILTRFNPDHGSYTSYRFEFVGGILGGDWSFVKLVYNWAKYNRLGGHTIFASRIRLGWVTDFGSSSNVPVKERFYLGGAYTVRGFPENDLGPKAMQIETRDSTADTTFVPIGGEAIVLLNLELRKPLIGNLWWSYFIDAGMNVPEIRDASFSQFAVTTGLGIQYISPVGPIRFDLGHRLGINRVNAGNHLHIGILFAF